MYNKDRKLDQVSIKYTNIFRCKTFSKSTQIRIFGLKTNHLATLFRVVSGAKSFKICSSCGGSVRSS
jgi:hypothetical protein